MEKRFPGSGQQAICLLEGVCLALLLVVGGCSRPGEDARVKEDMLFEVPTGESIHVRRVGVGPTPLLLLPGNNCSGESFHGLMRLAETSEEIRHAFTVYAFDYRGSGGSSYRRPVDSLEDFALDFDGVVEQLPSIDAGNAFLIGHSMGFGVAQLMMDLRPQAYGGAISLAGIGTRGVRVFFAGGTVGDDPETGRTYAFGDWADSLSAVAFQQRAWYGTERTRTDVRNVWTAIVFNDVSKVRGENGGLGDLDEEGFERLIDDVLAIRYMPESLYAAHRFNVSDVDLEHANSDGTVVRIPGADRLDAFEDKRILLVKAATDRLRWRGDLVIDDSITQNTKYDLRSAGAHVTTILLHPGQGYDHGFPLHHPEETWGLIRWFVASGGEPSADTLESVLDPESFTRVTHEERDWERAEYGGF